MSLVIRGLANISGSSAITKDAPEAMDTLKEVADVIEALQLSVATLQGKVTILEEKVAALEAPAPAPEEENGPEQEA